MFAWKAFLTNYRLWRRRWFYPLISVVVALSVCLTTPLPGRAFDLLPLLFQGVQIFQLSNISDRQEVDLGKQINQELQGEVKLYRNAAITRYVEQIGQRLVANSDRPNLPYTFQVVEDKAINAFATAGGYVYVHTGLLQAADNEAELASVLAHEMGHIGGKHLVKQMRQQALASGVATAAGLDRNTAVGLGVQLALNLPRSRQDEFDADKRGLRTLTRSGYAQSGMVSFMQKLLGKGSTPTFLSTHPATSDRINALKKSINAQPSDGRYGLDNAAYKANIRALS
ncbi:MULTISPECIES: M48 family metallopeptidase [unclassified Tolypothrix]|uniref:M48 family metallopeptidase n=1 Tax=unclassified Tolypothrix TaxID=2649714 RepID=UPI0005EABB04|nr:MULTISPECIES: M48 family metalloprotease [unclassified Tolypothrix]BAY90494.1 peptidase M48 Ste24p [Microchaete diplosiphon NIES-3275]EKF01083.1 peptidase, M48 family [Tolypothrix sp. PCC 7601]MBE9082190.1 M48 family metallopeptidase [Tolypothrix sp. LEGE 11397]UYD24657.1 M48 family metallopeptidase [Tolypothrix sp. PCC 7712]UYD33114.1 M48 family metallopeptidase [Tolypothrix sp. PCC 7601]